MYNNNNYRGGYNRGYPNNRFNNPYPPRDPRGYNSPMPYEPSINIPFEVGQMVRHRATSTELSVVRIGREQVECRLPDLTSQWFYIHELEPIESNK